jgi:hypothetical protein
MRKDGIALKEFIQEEVKLLELLEETGRIDIIRQEVEQQISCPFHGPDSKPSARYYPDSNSMYCFTCKESWDTVSFIMKEKVLNFPQAMDFLVNKYRLNTNHLPDANQDYKKPSDRYSNKREESLKIDKKKLLMARLEDKIKRIRKNIDPEMFGKIIFVLAHMRKTEDTKAFTKMANKAVKAIKRYS